MVLVRKNVAQCSETNRKSIFRDLRFLLFEIRSFTILRFAWKKIVSKDAECSGTDFALNLKTLRSLVFRIWLLFYWELERIQKPFYVRRVPPPGSCGVWFLLPHMGLRPQAPDVFGLKPPSQLVIGYHWLAFLNQIRKNVLRAQFTSNVVYKIDHISKTKNCQIQCTIRFRTMRILWDVNISDSSKKFEKPYLKN